MIAKSGALDSLDTSREVHIEGRAAARSRAQTLEMRESVRLDRVGANGDKVTLWPTA
jgi:hypothetical protein